MGCLCDCVHVSKGICLFSTLLVLFYGEVADAELSVRASFNDTRCDGGSVCPTDPLFFTCEITESGNTQATVKFPSDMTIILLSTDMIVGDPPNGVTVFHNVTINDTHDFTLSLAIETASLLNGGMITCDSAVSGEVDMAGCPVAGAPGSPLDLRHDVMANTESSAVIRWEIPSNTGGNGTSISQYGIMSSDNGLSLTTAVSSDMLNYDITGLEYNTNYSVEVTAINSCGLKSVPANVSVNIEARAPPKPTLSSPVFHCDEKLKDGRRVVINWMYGAEAEGVVYPREVVVSVELDPGSIACSDVTTDDTNCTVSITGDNVYTVSLTLRNDVGSTQAALKMFNSRPLIVDEMRSDDRLNITVTLNENCAAKGLAYTVEVTFAVLMKDEDNSSCSSKPVIRRNESEIAPGLSLTFEVTGKLEDGQMYCYIASLDGERGTSGGTTEPTASSSPPLPPGAIIGIVVAAVVIIVVMIGILVVVVCLCCKKTSKQNDQELKNLRPSSGAVSPVEESSLPPVESGPTYQDPNTITHTPHPTTGQFYTDVNLDKKKKGQKTAEEEAGPMYQDPTTIEHQQAASGDVYAMPQKGKKGKKGKKKEKEEELTEEEKAALYSTPDRKGQKAKSEGLTYADLSIHPSSKPAPPSQGSTYADIQHPN